MMSVCSTMKKTSLVLSTASRIFGRRNKSGSATSFASVDPSTLGHSQVHTVQNLVDGKWIGAAEYFQIPDPMTGQVFIRSPSATGSELLPFIESLRKIPKSGRHNPFKNVERYLMYGQVLRKAAEELHKPEVIDFFAKCIQRVMPKSYTQCMGEMTILRTFCENFSGDQIRFVCRGFSVPGDYNGQSCHGHRWPYGPVCVISPFNFPLEICIMQILSAAMVGNKPLLKSADPTGLPAEQFIRFLHYCGLPKDEIDLISCSPSSMSELLTESKPRMLQFTGSTAISNLIVGTTLGRMKTEDSGFDWKLLGPDVEDVDYIAWQCDQDAYAMSGQKCSAQSLLAVHSNWLQHGLYDKIKTLAARRSLNDLTLSPVITHTTEDILHHVKSLASCNGARILFGGNELKGHTVYEKYGTVDPTAVFIPLESILDPVNFKTCTRELFGPVQVVTEWKDGQEGNVLELFERMDHHLTAAVVSNDMLFLQRVLGATVNGTTYAGRRARTTGAPQNHWFGPAGDPLAAGIGTPEAVLQTWTCHREIVFDHGPIPEGWTTPAKAT
eukprot:TRINITY_DN85563_c0_g1_i1.p1 TRINITY_DN85563_c0_g1~~TRINITY_DN85563_c0_g1_i1.p1  ORF type:complete len:554 (-),score=51.21 TRINITY_DN85563_c0_g1_i1:188-1849(-)